MSLIHLGVKYIPPAGPGKCRAQYALWATAQKGQWPMSGDQVMTNAMVANVAFSVTGGVLTLGYEGGAATIRLPDGVQVHRIVTVKPEDLRVGERVAIRGTAESDGAILASSVSFDQTGD